MSKKCKVKISAIKEELNMQEINQKITFSTTGDVDYEKVRTGQIPKEILSEVFDNILEHYDVPRKNCHEIGIKIN